MDSTDPGATLGPEHRSVPEQLLDAAFETAALVGLNRMSMADVARRAGLSRQTLYRHFDSREALVAAVVTRETRRITALVLDAAAAHDDAHDAIEAGLLAALEAVREHPLLDRLVTTEPEALVPLLVTEAGPVGGEVRAVIDALVSHRLPALGPVGLRRLADVVTRLLVSYAISAPDDPPEVVAAFLAGLFVQGAVALDPVHLPSHR